MNVVKYLSALWVTVAVYAVTLILWGPRGLSAYDQLKLEEERLQANMADLQQINGGLENTRKTLFHDRDTFILRARELGYAAPGERFVRIVGLPVNRQSPPNPGQVLSAGTPDYIPERILRIVSLCIGLGVLMVIGLWDFLRYCRRRSEQS